MRRLYTFALLTSLAIAPACSDSGTGPGGTPGGETGGGTGGGGTGTGGGQTGGGTGGGQTGGGGATVPNIAGVYAYNAKDLSGKNSAGGDRTCSVQNVTLTFQQSGGTLTGVAKGGTIQCTEDTEPVAFPEVPIVNASVSADSTVSFDIKNAEFRHRGTLANGTISGTAAVESDCCSLSGAFTATRQQQ